MSIKTCPRCAQPDYDDYANGSWREGYCQHCHLEVKVPCTENTLPKTEQSQRDPISVPKKDKKKQKHWTEV